MKNTTNGTSVKRAIVTLLITAFATPAFAADEIDFRSSIRKAVAEQQANVPQPAPAENPYKMGAIALIAGGIGLAAYGFTHTSGAEINVGTGGSVTAKETKSTGVGIAGLGIAALGGVVYMMGEKKARSIQPQISFGLNRAVVGGKVRW